MITTLLSALSLAALRPVVGSFSWFQLLPGFGDGSVAHTLGIHVDGGHDPSYTIPTAWAVVAFILLFAAVARMGLEAAKKIEGPDKYVPEAGLSPRNLFEIVVEWLLGLMESTIGTRKEALAFFPLVGTIFVYVLINNLSGFIPGVLPATEDMSHNFALAASVFVVFNYAGLSRQGFGYIKHLAGPIAAIAPIFFTLEAFSLAVRPVSLTFRLGVNIAVDHLLASIVRGLGAEFAGFIGGALLPVPLLFLGLLVCVVQAFVFALLTTIYISLSVAHDEHHEHGDGHAHAHH